MAIDVLADELRQRPECRHLLTADVVKAFIAARRMACPGLSPVARPDARFAVGDRAAMARSWDKGWHAGSGSRIRGTAPGNHEATGAMRVASVQA